MTMSATALVASLMLAITVRPVAATSELSGRVLFSGLAVPGATVTARQGSRDIGTVSDDDGAFHFDALEDGVWMLRVDMLGFVTESREITVPFSGPPIIWPLTMRPSAEIVGRAASPPAAASATPAAATDVGVEEQGELVDVINGSVNNGAATPFAQPRAFGNNRPSSGALYTGGLSVVLGNSAWNARPFSFGGSGVPAPAYGDAQLGFTLSGPLRIPRLLTNGPQSYVAYQHGVTHTAMTQSALMPTAAERRGDFSGSLLGVRDPLSGLPFSGNVIPAGRISPQAVALAAYYPQPNVSAPGSANYQRPVVTATRQDQLQLGVTQPVSNRTTLIGTFAFQRTVTDSVNLFDFTDTSRTSSLDAAATWARRFNPRLSLRVKYQFTRAATNVTPFFANRRNVSGEAGIENNNQDPANFGPPTLLFPDVADLRDVDSQHSVSQTHAVGAEVSHRRGRHNLTIGGDLRRTGVDVSSQPDPRGTLAFTGAASGHAFADFLLGVPATSAIAFGNTSAHLRGPAYDAYVIDDFRVRGGLTLNLGVRWEYEAPFTETSGRLVNLDVAPGLTAVHPVLATNPVGSLTALSYPTSLFGSDTRGVQPRLAVSWRPVAGSTLVVRASYGVYRNLGLYQPLALLLAQQPPFSRTVSVANGPLTPLTLADPFPSSLPNTNTFAVDRNFRAGFAHTWQVSAQRDLPASLTVIAAYLGAKGSHLPQASLPNTYPQGADNPCAICPSGFVYLTSNGRSLRNAGQFTIRRRLHNGFTASLQYTLAKSTDDAATFSNTTVSPKSLDLAQDWLDLSAERGPSSFDQRHLVALQFQYTSGVGVAGGTLVDGVRGRLFKDWTIASQLTAGSGLPITPVSFMAVPGTGVVGVRPSLTGVAPEPAPPGYYVNPGAYTAPVPGTWGNAGRNSIRGPRQFALDMSVWRVFRLRGRVNLEWRVAATNVLNRVTFATIHPVINSPQFGLPTLANAMRRVQTALRLRF